MNQEERQSVLAVIVLFGLRSQASISLETLQRSALRVSTCGIRLKVILHDNGPGGESGRCLPNNVLYELSPGNVGLAVAYNKALQMAQRIGAQWLLTLDQDTALPENYLPRMCALMELYASDTRIAAIVPQIIGNGKLLSPYWLWAKALPRWFPRGYSGIPEHPVYAFNSGSVLRVDALTEIGGYSPLFPLDNSDTNLYHQLGKAGKRVFVAGDLRVEHELSLLDMNRRMPIDRYRRLLFDECAFWDIEMNVLARVERKLRLLGRLYKHLVCAHRADLRVATFKELCRRMFVPRRRRLDQWRKNCCHTEPASPESSNEAQIVGDGR